jgi:streptogramin lyase
MEDFHRYIYFYTVDYTGMYTTSGYTLPITPFTFIPVFDDGNSTDFSNEHILWDFGDGTTSESITATHHYKLPGWYTVKCYILGKQGEGYIDAFSQNLVIKDFITDTLVVSGINNKTEAGTNQNPYVLSRFNSWQTYPSVSAEGYKIQLHVKDNVAPLLDAELYKKDKWGHLKASSRFEASEYNTYTQKYERVPVNSIKTDNHEIYVRYFKNKLELCDKSYDGACFAGTSGSKMFYFIDDLPKKVEKKEDEQAVTIFVSFDTTKFKDLDNLNKKYPESEYPVLNSIYNSTGFSVIIEQLNSDHITITSNGIDDDNNGSPLSTFNITQQKFAGQKIPFVARIKDFFEFPSKYNPVLTLKNILDIVQGEIYLELRDEYDRPIPNASFYSSMGKLSTEKNGGFFKGYVISDKPYKNVSIFAKSIAQSTNKYLINTTYGIVSQPMSEEIHSITIQKDTFNKTRKTIADNIINVGLRGIYSSCVVSKRLPNGRSEFTVWLVDADREKILKYNPVTNDVLYDQFVLPENSSPSNVCSDKDGNVWVTLYDSISTVRINNLSNTVDRIIKPSLPNTVISQGFMDYQNTITPASVDVDLDNNVWVSYANELSSFVEKYDFNGNFIFNVPLTPNYETTEIIVDLDYNAWGIAKDLTTNTKILSAKNDKIYKISKDGQNVVYYNINGSLWNITFDVNGNIWATRNRNEVVVIDTLTNTTSTFKLSSNSVNSVNNYISDLEGIACTTDNFIVVADNANQRLHYFNANVNYAGFEPKVLDLKPVSKTASSKIQDKINAYGDWNGFKYINKFQNSFGRPSPVYGYSNTFNIYPSTEGEYEIRKVNENFDPKRQIMAYRFQDYLLDSPLVFENFIGTTVGTLSSKPNELGKVVYEKISNFIDNIHNIDTCNIKSLQSMYEMLGEDFYTFNNTNYNLPAELGRLMDIFSIKFSKLKGSKDKFDSNFDNKGYNNDSLRENNQVVNFGINKGKELDFLTAVLTAGHSIVAYEKFSENYRILNTDILSSTLGDIKFIDETNRTYLLSTYHPNWGWGLALPKEYINDQIPLLYSFYEYVSGYTDVQNEGVINWSDEQNTIPYDIKSQEQWREIKEKLIYYSLAKGLGVIK